MSTIMQKRIVALGTQAFGEKNMLSRDERLLRFLEEGLELVQAGGITQAQVTAMVDYAYERPKETEIWKEFGGVQMTLFSAADAFGLDLGTCIRDEITRFIERLPTIQKKHAAKPAQVRAV